MAWEVRGEQNNAAANDWLDVYCWRCMERPVAPDDDLGLCPRCR